MLFDSDFKSLGNVTDIMNIIFGFRLINQETILMNRHTIPYIQMKNHVRFENKF